MFSSMCSKLLKTYEFLMIWRCPVVKMMKNWCGLKVFELVLKTVEKRCVFDVGGMEGSQGEPRAQNG